MMYYELSNIERGMFGICAIVLMIMAVSILISVCTSHMGGRYVLFASLLSAAVFFVLQGMDDVNYLLPSGRPLTYFAKIIGNLPYGVVAVFLLLSVTVEIIFVSVLWQEKRNRLSPGAVKEGLDALPDGVCFFDAEGQPLLVNIQMNRICGELFETEILNAESFWNSLKNKEVQAGESIGREPTVLIRTKDGRIWDVHRNLLTVRQSEIHELIAYDVTRQYALNGELDKRNQQLSRVNERLQLYSREVEKITVENELLSAKIRVHDNVGRSLLAFRSYLAQPSAGRDRESLLLLWRYTIEVLKNEAVPALQQDPWELLLKAAQAVDVEIVRKGDLPESGKEREILIGALHECLTNTVKHANGNKLYLSVCLKDNAVVAEFTNNGAMPEKRIQETGGLKNIRHTVEMAGGSMTIESVPRFLLRVELPKGDE